VIVHGGAQVGWIKEESQPPNRFLDLDIKFAAIAKRLITSSGASRNTRQVAADFLGSILIAMFPTEQPAAAWCRGLSRLLSCSRRSKKLLRRPGGDDAWL